MTFEPVTFRAVTFETVKLVATEPGRRETPCTGRRWFTRVLLLAVDGPTVEVATAAGEESGLLVLSGTHDLEAGAGSWISRGTRTTPFEGRPVALFLPPKTRFRAKSKESSPRRWRRSNVRSRVAL